ncbi:MAG: signal peptidase I [Candidatus Levybacteria bacterium RBG_16_35_11]|nr:MAG: signal peptidase I [Candidatus Levybacteria bacterium RBG_16_35_11]
MKKLKKLIYGTLTTIIFIALPFIVFTLITSKTDAILGIKSFVVLSGSMQPTIPQGSIVFTQKSPYYGKEEIIAFQQGDVAVTHRIIDIVSKDNAQSYITKGDANNSADTNLVQKEKVLGTYLISIPYVGRFVLFLKTFPGFIAFVIFPALVFIGFEFWNIKKEIEKSAERKLMERMQIT